MNRRMCDTIHPQIHDSDRLAMWTGSGEWICRPLNNPQRLTYNAYQDENPRGFGMLQLNHDFDSYQDVIGWYNKRPSLWVEPVGKWGKGAINLMEIPTTGETLDNIVCCWQPAVAIKAGSEHSFSYKLYWSGLPPVRSGLSRVNATRSGMGASRKAGRQEKTILPSGRDGSRWTSSGRFKSCRAERHRAGA